MKIEGVNAYSNNEEIGYRICAGISCSRRAKYQLTILYLNKRGWFCGECKNELIEDGLVMEMNEERF